MMDSLVIVVGLSVSTQLWERVCVVRKIPLVNYLLGTYLSIWSIPISVSAVHLGTGV